MELEGRKFQIPLTHPVRGVTERSGTLYQGSVGWGEFSPFPGYPGSRERCMESALYAAFNDWPEPVRESVPVYVTIPDVDAETARLLASGWTAAKVKVGSDEDADLARLEAIRDVIGPKGWLMVDANGVWSVEEAAARVDQMRRLDVALVEQPCSTLEDLARVRRLVDVPIAADESFSSVHDAKLIRDARSADVVVVKLQYLGGATAARRALEESGLAAIVSSPFETSIGISYGVAFAASLPSLPFPCGLATAQLLAGDVVEDPLVPENGELRVRRVEPSEDLLLKFSQRNN